MAILYIYLVSAYAAAQSYRNINYNLLLKAKNSCAIMFVINKMSGGIQTS